MDIYYIYINSVFHQKLTFKKIFIKFQKNRKIAIARNTFFLYNPPRYVKETLNVVSKFHINIEDV